MIWDAIRALLTFCAWLCVAYFLWLFWYGAWILVGRWLLG